MIHETSVGAWHVAAEVGAPRCGVAPAGWYRKFEPDSTSYSATATVSATVDVQWRSSGLIPRALVSGLWRPSNTGSLTIEVGHTGPLTLESAKRCDGLLGMQLVHGLPEEFAQAALDGLADARTQPYYDGVLRIVGGGYDEVGSSYIAFAFAGRILRLLLHQMLSANGTDLEAVTSGLSEPR